MWYPSVAATVVIGVIKPRQSTDMISIMCILLLYSGLLIHHVFNGSTTFMNKWKTNSSQNCVYIRMEASKKNPITW